MKKTLGLFLAVIIFGTACKKNYDYAFDKSPDERVMEALNKYNDALTNAPHGWKAILMPDSGKAGSYSFYFKFDKNNRVQMFADFDSTTSVVMKESSFRLKALQQPSLIFDTYSYIHLLSDPDAGISGGTYGGGLKSDFEFALNSIVGDTIKMTGRFNGSKAYLVKATEAEKIAYYAGEAWTKGGIFNSLNNKIYNYWKRVTIDGVEHELVINSQARTMFVNRMVGTDFLSDTIKFFTDVNGVHFNKSFTTGSKTVSGFSDLSWNAATSTFSLSIDGVASSLAGAIAPVKNDPNAPKAFWDRSNNEDTYWISVNSFHRNGVDDFFSFQTKVPRYYYFLYWAGYGSNYDAVGVVYVNSSNSLSLYGPAVTPSFTAIPGRIKYSYLGTLGTSPNSATTSAMTATGLTTSVRTVLSDAAGFYLVKTSADSYDMVSANDAKTWITWEWLD